MSARGGPVVTVDGPAGSGKTTLGGRVALRLGLPLVDTGLFYRALSVAAARHDLREGDAEAAGRLARAVRIEVNTDPGRRDGWEVRLDGEDLTGAVHDPGLAPLLSALSALAPVREALLEDQRRPAARGAVAVGRDCGTVVFPDAEVKLYLVASTAVRARRRGLQLGADGVDVDAGAVHDEIVDRDRRDASRAVAPLRPAADAHIIDTGSMDVDGMVSAALDLCREAGITPSTGGGL